MSATLMDRIIRTHAQRIGTTKALVTCGRSDTDTDAVTWRELDEATQRHAVRLRALAADRGQPCLVMTLIENNLAELLALVACLRTDAPVLVLGGRQPGSMRQAIVEQVGRVGYAPVIATPEPPEVAAAAARPVAGGRRTNIDGGCVLLASGGSTGRPKLVVDRGIRATPARPAVIRPFLTTGWRDGQRQVVCSPLYHAAGLAPFVEGLVSGNTSYVLPVFDGPRLGDLVDRYAIDWLQMTPFHMGAVLAGTRGPASWRRAPRLVHLAERCPPRIKRAFHDALGSTRVYEMYTASEGIGMTMARGDEWEERPGTVGRGFFTALRVADDDGRSLAPHRIGAVYMRRGARIGGPYLGATGRLRTTPDGFATLGDIGHLDEEGYLYLRPRQVATISVAGVTVSPTEVEAELIEHPQIADVGVCSDASTELGERVVAVVVPAAGGLTESAVRRWARARLDAAAVPARCVFAAALPRRETGKLDRAALFALVNGTDPGPSGEVG
jgi:bile acid-coenzyme A ligase